MTATILYGVVNRQTNEGDTNETSDELRDVEFHGQQHDNGERTDGVVSAMFKVDKLVKCAFVYQKQSHRAHEHGTNGKTQHDDDDVVGDGKCANNTIKTK